MRGPSRRAGHHPGGAHHRSALRVTGLISLLLLAPAFGSPVHGNLAGAAPAALAARADGSGNCSAPSSLLLPTPGPSGSLSASATLVAATEFEVVGYTPSLGNLTVHIPRLFYDFALANGSEITLSHAPTTLTADSGEWSGPTALSAERRGPIQFHGGREALLTSELLAVMASTDQYEGLSLSFRWAWGVSFTSGAVNYSAWAFNTTDQNCPSVLWAAPYVELVAEQNQSGRAGTDFNASIEGYVAGQYFFLELENTTGSVIYSNAQTAPSNETGAYEVGITYASWYGPVRPGPYLVHLHNVMGALLYSLSVEITAADGLTANASASVLWGAPPLTVHFTGTPISGRSPYHYAWSFGDGSTGTGPTVVHTYTAAGVYHCDLEVTDANGDLAEVSLVISVAADPPGSLSVHVSANVTSGGAPLAVAFRANVTGGNPPYTVSWSFGDGYLGTGATTTHEYLDPGVFDATATVIDSSGAIAMSTVLVTVTTGLPALTLAISANESVGPAPLSARLCVNLSGAIEPFTLTWSLGNGQQAEGATCVDAGYPAPGVYPVRVEVKDRLGRSATAGLNVTAFAPLTADAVAAESSVVTGTTDVVRAMASGGYGALQYRWMVNGANASNGSATYDFRATVAGSYEITLEVLDARGDRANASTQVDVMAAGPTGHPHTPPLDPVSPPAEWIPFVVVGGLVAAGIAGLAAYAGGRPRHPEKGPPAPPS